MATNILNNSWFINHICPHLPGSFNVKNGPITAKSDLESIQPVDVIYINLDNISFISLFELQNLYLWIDCLQAATGRPVYLMFPGISNGKQTLIDIDEFNQIRKSTISSLKSNDLSIFNKSKETYNLIAFMHHFGFFEAFKKQNDMQKVVFPGMGRELLGKLLTYRGAKERGSNVLGMYRIEELDSVDIFRDTDFIGQWINELGPELSEFPLFRDGEFSRVFCHQLATNIIEHSGTSHIGATGALGIVSMRILPSNKKYSTLLSIPECAKSLFTSKNKIAGVLEICVGDRGVGIISSLKQTYMKIRRKTGIKSDPTDVEIISFAFSELGTRKPLEDRLGGVHALNRIFRCVGKYQGVIRVRTGGVELAYALKCGTKLFSEESIGYLPSHIRKDVTHPFGLQYQILLPIEFPRPSRSINLTRKSSYYPKTYSSYVFEIVPVSYYLSKHSDSPIEDRSIILAKLVARLSEVSDLTFIVFDFAKQDLDWLDEELEYFLYKIKQILHQKKCIGINLESGIARLLREREQVETFSKKQAGSGLRSFFDVLSSKHRLLPIMDTKNEIWWFGLGRYPIDPILKYLYEDEAPNYLEDILNEANFDSIFFEKFSAVFHELKILLTDTQSISSTYLKKFVNKLNELLSIYSANNPHIIGVPTKAKRDFQWRAFLSQYTFDKALLHSISQNIEHILKNKKCIRKDAYYKLPARLGFAEKFFQSASLLQDNTLAKQIGGWAAYEFRKLVKDSSLENILLVCTTASAELLAQIISHHLQVRDCYVVNLGHYSQLDEEGILEKGGWSGQAIIVADVIDTKRTVCQIIEKLESVSINTLGLISLVSFFDPEEENYVNRGPSEKEINCPRINKKVYKSFSLYSFERPGIISAKLIEKEEENITPECKLWLVEPFSLELFNFYSLTRTQFTTTSRGKINEQRLRLLEEKNVIAAGHWIYGSHHFKVTTSIKKMLNDDVIGGDICQEILKICRDQQVDHILLPLHSQISKILPRLIYTLKMFSEINIDYTFFLTTKILSTSGFYTLPKKIADLISRYSNEPNSLSFLILDDAVASGRTLETIIRAIMRGARKTARYKSPIKSISVFSIIDRQGRAKSTLLSGIKKIDIFGDSEADPPDHGNYLLDFSYDKWISVDMPIDEAETCDLCTELNTLMSLVTTVRVIPEDLYVIEKLRKRISDIDPVFMDSPLFDSYSQRHLPDDVKIGEKESSIFETVLWEFHNLLHRGCPFSYIINQLLKFDECLLSDGGDNESRKNLILLKVEIVRRIFREWNRLTSQWGGYDFFKYICYEFSQETELVETILYETAFALATAKAGRSVLVDIFHEAMQRLMLTELENPRSKYRLDLFGHACLQFSVVFKFTSTFSKSGYKHDNFQYLDIKEFIDTIDPMFGKTEFSKNIVGKIYKVFTHEFSSIDFVSEFKEVLNHTVRAARHSHTHLFNNLLRKITLETSLSEIDERNFLDTLREFKRSLSVVLDQFPILFANVDDQVTLLIDRMNMMEKMILNQSNFPNYDWAKVQDLAQRLINILPCQAASKIYDVISKTQVSLKCVIQHIEEKCRIAGIQLKIDNRCPKDTHIMIPSWNKFFGILENYTYGVNFKKILNHRPMLEIKFEKNDEDTHDQISMIILSNLKSFQEISDDITTGPGLQEFKTPSFELFNINCVFKESRKAGYQLELVISFLLGHKTFLSGASNDY